jgi:hypothetical protein
MAFLFYFLQLNPYFWISACNCTLRTHFCLVYATYIPSSIFYLLCFHVGALIQKYCFTLPKKEVRLNPYFWISTCNCTWVRRVHPLLSCICNLYTIFNIFFIVLPCGCTYPKILFYLTQERGSIKPIFWISTCNCTWVRRVHPLLSCICNLYTIFNIFFIVLPCGCTYPKILFYLTQERDSKWVHPKFDTILLLKLNNVLNTQDRIQEQ